jgi:hypothetical protein
MRKWVLCLVLPVLAAPAWADDNTARDILDKAVKAHGGAERLLKFPGARVKGKGKLAMFGGAAFSQEASAQMPNKFKEVVNLEIMGQKVTVTTGFDGTKGWVQANGMNIPVDDKLLAELKEAAYMMAFNRLTGLTDKSYQLAPLGEIKVNDRPALGVRISSKGHRDVNLYFDKENGLLVKNEHRVLDQMAQQEVTEERILSEYKDHDGLKMPGKVVITRDSKPYLDMEITEVKLVDKIDDSEFAAP